VSSGGSEPAKLAVTLGSSGEWKNMIVENEGQPRKWFGPKRIGYGLRPQTWQGWLIVVVPVVVIAVVAFVH
jgi:hypothetical protein